MALLALIAPGEQVADEMDDLDFAVEQVDGEPISNSMMEPQALGVLESLSFG